MKFEDFPCEKTDEITLDFIKFGIMKRVSNVFPLRLRFEKIHEPILNNMIYQITYQLLGKEIETVKYPKTWWGAFKNRWFPNFLKKRFPVEWNEFKLYNICPHINIDFSKNQKPHLAWLEKNHGFSPFTNNYDKDENAS